MLVFMVGSSGVLVLLRGIMRGLCRCRNGGKKTPREAGLSLKKGGTQPLNAAKSFVSSREQQPDNPAHAREHCVSISVV
jgi:hypothetical protein